jgi:predicted  nucleic acid-binding Zn-ribbon protein
MTHSLAERIAPPFLMIKRFVVTRGDHFVYDQQFKLGLNIIRGDNTTGKSTIMDLMYFALGAELTEWTTEQELCDETIMEVHLNYTPYCLRREITETGKSAMYIFEGTMNDALSNLSKWFKFPNVRSNSVQSYSQKIFELLALPSHKTDDSKNLTMHQLLRLMYIDQLSETTKLLKEDKKFDNSSLRRAIGEYLLGIDNLDAHNVRQELIDANSRFDKANAELKAIYRFVGLTNSIIREEQINVQIQEIETEINELNRRKEEIKSEDIDKLNDEIKESAREIVEKTDNCSIEARKLRDEKDELSSEIVDTSLFLESLEQRLEALEQSKATNSEIGELIFKYCPACLTPIAFHDTVNHCGLCKEDLSSSHRHYAYIQMSNEIRFQKKESEQLLDGYKRRMHEINIGLSTLSREIDYLRGKYQDLVTGLNSADSLMSEIGGAIGYKRGIISSLEEKREMIGEVERLIATKSKAQSDITALEEKLALLEASTKNRHDFVYSTIEDIAKNILHMDGGYEDAFEKVEDVQFDFDRDKMRVNGRSKFSASSMVVMKNAIRIAIFLHCINDEKARLPRFLLVDNIEDKGMTEPRSQNFQRKIVEMCDELEKDYQIIFTTSMIDPDLDKSEYVVGPHYKKGEHTLALN